MKILVFGAGAIGSIYGYFLSKAGNEVTHYVRPDRAGQLSGGLDAAILDGRDPKNVREIRDRYNIRTATKLETGEAFDLILVSVRHSTLKQAAQTLTDSGVRGDILFFNSLWKDYSSLDGVIGRERYLWGYPVAGGNVDYERAALEGAILDNVILGETNGDRTQRLEKIAELFRGAGIKAETPKDVLHWIWVHMAVNAGVISTALKLGSAEAFMNSASALREGIRTMREALKVVEARGVNLDDYKNDVRMFYLPTLISSVLFKYYFKKNVLSRKIMSLHNNPEDLYDVCNDVYESAKELGVSTPLLDAKAKYFRR